MKLTRIEIEYLSAWAREEWEPDCYRLPAHKLQPLHGVKGADLVDLMKAWTITEGKRDQDILNAAANLHPNWPWSSDERCQNRIREAKRITGHAEEVAV